jgi:hypothetical protein
MRKAIIFFSIVILLFNQSVVSQKIDRQKWIVDFPENVNTPLTSKENMMIEQAFGTEVRDKILSNKSRLKDIKDILRNRVEVINAKEGLNKYLKAFHILPLNDTELLLPKAFDPNNFNPLLYKFNFHSKSTLVYRVDNTSYLIFIRPRELR